MNQKEITINDTWNILTNTNPDHLNLLPPTEIKLNAKYLLFPDKQFIYTNKCFQDFTASVCIDVTDINIPDLNSTTPLIYGCFVIPGNILKKLMVSKYHNKPNLYNFKEYKLQ